MSVRAVWLLVAAVVLIGYGTIYQPQEREANAYTRQAEELYAERRADDAELQRAFQISAARRRVDDDLTRLAGAGSQSATTAIALRILESASRRFEVEVRSIEPQPSPPSGRDLLDRTPVTLGLRGRFRNIATLLDDLPRHDVLIGVDGIELMTHHRDAITPVLDATVHVSIYRLRSEDRYASATP
jgi:Tfp pilus assembly protein PilO